MKVEVGTVCLGHDLSLCSCHTSFLWQDLGETLWPPRGCSEGKGWACRPAPAPLFLFLFLDLDLLLEEELLNKRRPRVLISCSKLGSDGVNSFLLKQLSRKRGGPQEQVCSKGRRATHEDFIPACLPSLKKLLCSVANLCQQR